MRRMNKLGYDKLSEHLDWINKLTGDGDVYYHPVTQAGTVISLKRTGTLSGVTASGVSQDEWAMGYDVNSPWFSNRRTGVLP